MNRNGFGITRRLNFRPALLAEFLVASELQGQLVALAESQNQGRDGAIAIPATFMRVTVRP